MDWTLIIYLGLISIGGFTAVMYVEFADGLAGHYFQRGAIMNNLGVISVFIAAVATAILNPWWSLFIVLGIGYMGHWIFMSMFRKLSQPLSVFLVLSGVILVLIKII